MRVLLGLPPVGIVNPPPFPQDTSSPGLCAFKTKRDPPAEGGTEQGLRTDVQHVSAFRPRYDVV